MNEVRRDRRIPGESIKRDLLYNTSTGRYSRVEIDYAQISKPITTSNRAIEVTKTGIATTARAAFCFVFCHNRHSLHYVVDEGNDHANKYQHPNTKKYT